MKFFAVLCVSLSLVAAEKSTIPLPLLDPTHIDLRWDDDPTQWDDFLKIDETLLCKQVEQDLAQGRSLLATCHGLGLKRSLKEAHVSTLQKQAHSQQCNPQSEPVEQKELNALIAQDTEQLIRLKMQLHQKAPLLFVYYQLQRMKAQNKQLKNSLAETKAPVSALKGIE